MAITTKSLKVIKPTDDVLATFARLERTAMERPLSTSRLEYLRAQMSKGAVINPPKWAVAYCKWDGRQYRLNGQHTSKVFGEFPETVRPQVVYEEYECDTLDDVATLFQGFDPRESVRSAGDVTRVVFAANPVLDGYPVRLGQALVGGVFMAKMARREWDEGVIQATKTNGRGVTSGDKAKEAAEHSGFASWLRTEFSSNESAAILGRAPVIAAMLLTREKDGERAEAFWKAVRDGSDANPRSASRVLREFLQAVRLTSGNNRSTRMAAGQREILFKSLQAYRFHREGAANVRLSYRDTSLLPGVS